MAQKKRRLLGEINVVPYIDVMLVLLIIFMVTAPLLTQGIDVELPKANAKPLDRSLTEDDLPLVLSVDANGQLYLNTGSEGNTAYIEEEVVRQTQIILASRPETPVLVKADHRVQYGRVVTAMVLLQQGGAERIGFITDPPDTNGVSQ
ncbi:MAG: protein TolR [Pseudomonadota bacterium]